MNREVQVRICEWLGDQFPGPLGLGVRFPGPTHPVLGFQYREEAEKFLKELEERVRKFGLELHPEKTRLIEFGRYAAERRGKRGEGKPETFNFLGFTHICGKNHVTGYFMVLRKTMGKRMAAKLKEIRQKLRVGLHDSTKSTMGWLQSVVRGIFPIPRGTAQRGTNEGVPARGAAHVVAGNFAGGVNEPAGAGTSL